MKLNKSMIIDNREISFADERNLLEVIRGANIDLPTFCYHSELSVYGACRLCMVEIEGKGLQASCSINPEDGMIVKTNTPKIRELRKTILELLLANHDYSCPTCPKSTDCRLQDLAKRVGIDTLNLKSTLTPQTVDKSSISIIRDPNRCVLCGDCVRVCSEIQSVGAIDFAHRGSHACVQPAFGNELSKVECVDCGQCVRVCPTGALNVNPQIDKAWKAIHDSNKKVVVQIAPAVRVALAEKYGYEPGVNTTGKIVSALKIMGVDKVFDTSFSADLTILEEANEFLKRSEEKRLPLFTSCCPAWVKFAEQYYPELLENISTCRSPQQMFGKVAKDIMTKELGINKKDMVVISIMPCSAKKFEASREEFNDYDIAEVDVVITTNELSHMIDQQGIDFRKLSPESLDMPMGFKTGAGVIFGNSGGVSEAVLRYLKESITGVKSERYKFEEVRGKDGYRKTTINIAGKNYTLGIVHGLKNARKIIQDIKNEEEHIDLIEVMACPGGCVGGAGQPVYNDKDTLSKRTEGLYDSDKTLQLHCSQDNPYIKELYEKYLGKPNSLKAHKLLHTGYKNRKRIVDDGISLLTPEKESLVKVAVCIGTSCYTKGSQKLISILSDHIKKTPYKDRVELRASFCFENCGESPNVLVNQSLVEKADVQKVVNAIEKELEKEELKNR